MNRTTLFALVALLVIPCQAMALIQTSTGYSRPGSAPAFARYFRIFEPTIEDCDGSHDRPGGIAATIRWDRLLNSSPWISAGKTAGVDSLASGMFTSRQIAAALNPEVESSLLLMGVRGSKSKYSVEIFTPGTIGRDSEAATKGLAKVWQQTMPR
ncbi:MAG: hypothetical protein KAR47_05695 [Planctomycetes bacterium]|nr:hypothetical protein [Planctomycetota bacterium]